MSMREIKQLAIALEYNAEVLKEDLDSFKKRQTGLSKTLLKEHYESEKTIDLLLGVLDADKFLDRIDIQISTILELRQQLIHLGKPITPEGISSTIKARGV